MKRTREVLLQHGWQESPTSDGWWWVAGPGRVMRPAFVYFCDAACNWFVHGAGGVRPLRGRLVYPCAIPPGVRIPQQGKAEK